MAFTPQTQNQPSPADDSFVHTWDPVVESAGKAISYIVAGILISICLVSIPRYVGEALSIFRLDEAGYGDSYILYDVLNFQKTGIIYRDLSQPPYLPAQYSPLVYVLYSLPGRVTHWENAFVAPRLVVIAAFLFCIGIATSIVRTVIPLRFAWAWGLLIPFSTRSMWNWILQIRADFPGIAFGLLAIRLLMSDSGWAVLGAGLCAGLAVQFKLTLVAAASAGALWLLVQKRWNDFARFTAVGVLVSIGPYLLYSLREPRMFKQMFVLSPGIKNITGNLALMDDAVTELVILLALFGLASIEWREWRTWAKGTLVLLFAGASVAIAVATDMQAGGNINYYFELFFGILPIAVIGVFRIMELTRRSVLLGLAMMAILVIHFLVPASMQLYTDLGVLRSGWVETGNTEIRQVEQALSGHRTFSVVPRLALLEPSPPLMEPYLLSYLHRLGKVDLTLFTEPIRREEYDAVITNALPVSWRGISHTDPTLRDAISNSYKPYCKLQNWLFHLPNEAADGNTSLAQALTNIGCLRLPADAAVNW